MAKTASTKKSRPWLIVLSLAFCLVAAALALLPSILSSQWGKQRAMNLAGPHIPGELRLDSWSLSWLGEQKLTGITYGDQRTGVKLDAAGITITKGLIGFISDRGNLGTVTVSRPSVQIRLPESAPKEGTADQPPEAGGTPAGAATPGATPAPGPGMAAGALPPISGRLVIEQGSLAVVRADEPASPVAKDISLEVDLVSAVEPIAYRVAMSSPDETGKIAGEGKVQLDLADLSPTALQSAGELAVTSWDISQLLDLAAAFTELPSGGGILDSKTTFAGNLQDGIKFDGSIDLTNLQLSGGPLTDDKLALDKTALEFSAISRTGSFELSALKLSSPLASGNLAAAFNDGGALRFNSDLRVDLAQVANQLPHTLHLQEGLKITGGLLAVKAEVDRQDGENRFSTNGVVEGLAGVRDKKQIALAEPFSLTLTGSQGKGGLSLENFTVQSSFLKGTGRGDLNDLQLSLDADLDAALKEISQFISLQNYQASGQLTLSLEAKRADEKTVGLNARLGVDKLTVNQGKTLLVPKSPLKLEADAALLLSPEFVLSGAREAQLSYQAWFGQGSLKGRELLLTGDSKLKSVADLVAGGDLRLRELGVMLQSLGALPAEFSFEGDSRFDLKVSGEDDRLVINSLILDSPKLSLKKGATQLIPVSPLKISARGEVKLGPEGGVASVAKPDLDYECWLGSGKLTASAFDAAAISLLALSFDGKTDLTKLTTLLSGLEIMPPGLSLSGTENTSLAMDYAPEQIKISSLRTEIDNFVFTQQDKTYRDKRLVIDTAGAINMTKRQVAFAPLHLDSANAAVSFEQLTIGDWDNLLDTLDSAGQAKFELTTVLAAAADWVSLPPDLATKGKIDLNWNADAHSSTEHRYRLAADLSNFSLARAQLQAFANEQASVRMNGVRNPTTKHLTLDQLAISSQPVSLDAAGHWNTGADKSTELSFKGDLAMDLGRISELVKTFTELDLEMVGKSQKPFQLALNVSPEQRQTWWKHANFSTAFQVDMIKMMGVELRSLEIPIQVSDGFAKAEIKGSANQGALLLQPELDLTSNPPLLSIPDNSLVLDKMQITPEMANQLLARIHPLFKGASQMSGVFDLNLEYFSWPLGKENLNDLKFAGTMDFEDMRIKSSALIGSLLQVMRVEETGLDLSGQQIQFACQDGRVVTNPLRTNLGDSELIIGGSLGLDTTIDYLAQVPVTERLVGGDLYKYLAGTVIQVPIGGTLAKPDISAQTVQRAVTDLINQAGQKKLQEAAGNLLKKLF